MNSLHSVLGLVAFVGLAWALSERRGAVSLRTVAVGVGIQVALALLLLKLPLFQDVFLLLNRGVNALQEATRAGTSFVFGYLGGGPFPVEVGNPGSTFLLAFQALPLVLVMSALSALLFRWRVLPLIVNLFSRLLQRSLGIGGALGLGAAANVFVGMVESPLLIRPYLARMNRSEIFALMTCGMATIAGTMMALYGSLLGKVLPNAMGHILTASLVSAPAALTVALILVPPAKDGAQTEGHMTAGGEDSSAMDAITRGTIEGINLLIPIIAMLVVLVSLVALLNQMLGLFPDMNGSALTLQRILGWLMAPVVWLMGIPWAEAQTAGMLMGTKTILNEFIAYMDLANLAPEQISDRSRLIMTYALCGFANFGSLGIMIGGMGSMAPEKRSEIVSLGMKSILSGTLATLMTGAVVGIILG